jgi:Dolichyl-phosphate-mannose-protein mannosyltransferase
MKNKKLLLLFSISLIVRLLYCFAMPFFKVKLDEQRYDILSNQILNGNYDLDAISFICAPFMPFFIAFIKSISTNYWQEITFVLQSILTSISVVYLFKLTDLLFKNKQISTIAAWFYCFYPMTFYYVKNVGQESFFQSFLIISVYFLIKFSTLKATKDLIISAILFSICFLTKGIILFWSPFIVFFIFRIKDVNFKEKTYNALIFSGLCLIFTLPFGIYNFHKHNVYTFSSDGFGHYFWFGNSEYGYHRDVLGTTYDINN